MPGIVDEVVNELNGDSPSHKENSGVNRSPKSTLSAHSTRSTGNDLPPDGVVDTSIEQLYENVCDMQSSDQSPSRRSFRSDGEESRIDSELRHLVGGEMTEVEIMEEEVHSKPMDDSHSDSSSKKEGSPLGRKKGSPLGRKSGKIDKVVDDSHSDSSSKKGSSPLGKKSGKMDKSRSPSINVTSPGNSKKVGHMQVDAETSSKSVSKGKSPDKPPIRKPSDKSLQKHGGATPLRKLKNSPSGVSKIQNGTEDAASDLGPFLLKQARDLISAGDNPQKALELALRATKSFELSANGKPCLELVMCLHVTSAIYCSLGQYSEAIPILEQSIEISPIEEGQDHALAKFAGHMQLGDTYAMLGQLENSLAHYTTGLEIQKQVLGETDPRVGETCRYLAEAHVQALQFDEAQRLCQMALDSHKENGAPATLEEAADRRLMGLICETKGDHEAALEHLVLASMAMVANGQEVEVASVDSSIGDTYLSLSRYDEAIFAYQKALTVFKTTKGENHPSVGSVFIRLADLYNKTGKIRESIAYCENALRIYEKPMPGVPPEEMASGLTDVSAIYESMNELEQAVKLLQKALKIYNDAPGQQSTIAGIEAQMGVMYYMLENYSESYESFKRAISKLRATGEKKSAFFGIVLNQMGLVCVQRYDITEAQEFFEEARTVLEHECGPYHPDTLGVYSNLAGTYDAVGRLDDAIELLEFVVGMREEKLGTANPDVDDEKRRLAELLKETGRVRNRKTRSLENLLDSNSRSIITNGIKV